jgi:hypothetical protein
MVGFTGGEAVVKGFVYSQMQALHEKSERRRNGLRGLKSYCRTSYSM